MAQNTLTNWQKEDMTPTQSRKSTYHTKQISCNFKTARMVENNSSLQGDETKTQAVRLSSMQRGPSRFPIVAKAVIMGHALLSSFLQIAKRSMHDDGNDLISYA